MPAARSIDVAAIRAAAAAQAVRQTVGIADMAGYLAQQNGDASHRDVTGPLLSASGASGVVLHRGQTLAEWGDPSVPEMLFSASKSLLATVAGVAFDQGLLAHVDEGVHASVALPELATTQGQLITWRHLLQQTSQWSGSLWGKPTLADAQSLARRVASSAYRVASISGALLSTVASRASSRSPRPDSRPKATWLAAKKDRRLVRQLRWGLAPPLEPRWFRYLHRKLPLRPAPTALPHRLHISPS